MAPSQRQLEERKMRKERILSGALSVFKSKGLEGATMDEIATQSHKDKRNYDDSWKEMAKCSCS